MRAVITGAGGQDGKYLSAACKAKGWKMVMALDRAALDVASPVAVDAAVRELRPDVIFNLAARSATEPEHAAEHHATIGGGTLNILQSVRRHNPAIRVFLCGSPYQFKRGHRPIMESDDEDHSTEYGVARNYSRALGRCFRERDGLNVKFGILFNHESPDRDRRFISRIIADAAMAAARGEGGKVEVRDPSVRKEWLYAADTAEAIITLVMQDFVQEACIGCGVECSISEWAAMCFGAVGLDHRHYVKATGAFSGARTVANPARIFALGWRPTVSPLDLARMMVLRRGPHGVLP